MSICCEAYDWTQIEFSVESSVDKWQFKAHGGVFRPIIRPIMEFILQPWQLFIVILASWMNRHPATPCPCRRLAGLRTPCGKSSLAACRARPTSSRVSPAKTTAWAHRSAASPVPSIYGHRCESTRDHLELPESGNLRKLALPKSGRSQPHFAIRFHQIAVENCCRIRILDTRR